MQLKNKIKIYIGTIVNPHSDTCCDLLYRHALVCKQNPERKWVIDQIIKAERIALFLKRHADVEITDLGEQVIMPGFFDMHFHWVQDDVRSKPKADLLTWLKKYTWPYEAKFASKVYAKDRAKRFRKELLAVGTIGGACYSSLHSHTVEYALKEFQGDFIIGNVLMTMNSPSYLTHTKAIALKSVKRLAEKFREKYALTPRFAITTHPDVMSEGAKIAYKNRSFIQTHLSETPLEIQAVLSIYKTIEGFENVKDYTEVYDRCSLLSKKTIMGHGIYLSDRELKRLAQTKTAIAHCPTSNAPVKDLGLGSGLFNFQKAEKYKVRWALASDIGGGPYLSMIDVMNSYVSQNKKKAGATYVKALYRSTLAGAEILEIGKRCGNFKKNKDASFIVMQPPTKKVENVENFLLNLFSCQKNNRSKLDQRVLKVVLRGEEHYRR